MILPDRMFNARRHRDAGNAALKILVPISALGVDGSSMPNGLFQVRLSNAVE